MSAENKNTVSPVNKVTEKVSGKVPENAMVNDEMSSASSDSLASTLTKATANITDVATSVAVAGVQETLAIVEQIPPKMAGALNATGDYVYDIQQRITGELTARVRAQPMMSIGIAAILGFAISRYIKSK